MPKVKDFINKIKNEDTKKSCNIENDNDEDEAKEEYTKEDKQKIQLDLLLFKDDFDSSESDNDL